MTENTGEKNQEEAKQEKEMSFLDHLGELRKRIIYAVIWLLVGSVIAGVLVFEFNFIDLVLLRQAKDVGLELQNLRPFGQTFLFFKVVVVLGIIISFPMILFQLWKFIAPGLYDSEKKWVRSITVITSLCFLSGVAFSYFVMMPSMLAFAESFGSEQIKNMIDVTEYFSFVTMIMLASGLLFELPMLTYVLAKIGLVSSKLMRKYRRHSIIVILIIAAVLTPTPDPISQLIFSVPLFVLYEISILIARFTEKKRAQD